MNFVSIYIQEAHADDEWPIRTEEKLKIKQHETMEDRQRAGKLLQEEYGWNIPLFHDSMQNPFQNMYHGWPMRLVLVSNDQHKIVRYASGQIKPYEGFLQFQLFRHVQMMLDRHLGIEKDAVSTVQNAIDFTANYQF